MPSTLFPISPMNNVLTTILNFICFEKYNDSAIMYQDKNCLNESLLVMFYECVESLICFLFCMVSIVINWHKLLLMIGEILINLQMRYFAYLLRIVDNIDSIVDEIENSGKIIDEIIDYFDNQKTQDIDILLKLKDLQKKIINIMDELRCIKDRIITARRRFCRLDTIDFQSKQLQRELRIVMEALISLHGKVNNH